MIDDPTLPPEPRPAAPLRRSLGRRDERARGGGLPAEASAPAASVPSVSSAGPPTAPPPLDEWDLGGPDHEDADLGWGVVAPPDGGSVTRHDPSAPELPPPSPADPVPVARRGGERPLLLRVLRPWFEPRPGELRGAIVLLALALALSVALWFDASRRPVLDPGVQSAASSPATIPGTIPSGVGGADGAPVGGAPPGRADGSDGWGMVEAPARGPVVHVSGAVLRPGVVTLPERSRVTDAIDAVGGAMPDAQLDRLNLARVVEDGERVHVPRVGDDAPPPDEPASRGILPDGRIDLNAASQAELETLPGVGPARAQAIIAEREQRPFRVAGDLRRVPGIGEATFQRLAPLVAVR